MTASLVLTKCHIPRKDMIHNSLNWLKLQASAELKKRRQTVCHLSLLEGRKNRVKEPKFGRWLTFSYPGADRRGKESRPGLILSVNWAVGGTFPQRREKPAGSDFERPPTIDLSLEKICLSHPSCLLRFPAVSKTPLGVLGNPLPYAENGLPPKFTTL